MVITKFLGWTLPLWVIRLTIRSISWLVADRERLKIVFGSVLFWAFFFALPVVAALADAGLLWAFIALIPTIQFKVIWAIGGVLVLIDLFNVTVLRSSSTGGLSSNDPNQKVVGATFDDWPTS